VKPYQTAIEFQKKRIIEALRPGVQHNSLRHFLDIDDLAAIRPKELSQEKRREYLIHAFEQIGKKYDFNFNVETDQKIVCSELAFVVFNELPWPTSGKMITPDQVASMGFEGGPFEPVLILHQGKKVRSSLLQNFTAAYQKPA